MEYGLIGAKLGHSYSKIIHEAVCGYSYELHPLPTEEEAHAFMQAKAFKAINVTIPYKKLVIPYCDEVEPRAAAIGAVNTVVNRDGKLYGYNTDYTGFAYLARCHGVKFAGAVVLVLGTGGTHNTVTAVCQDAGAKQVLTASRTGKDGALTYEEAQQHPEINIIINTTPAGMYPNNGSCLLDLHAFPKLEAVLDCVYNPFRTELLLRAEEIGVPAYCGFEMLVAQAVYAAEYFLSRKFDDAAGEIGRITAALRRDMLNVALIGMPSSGNSSDLVHWPKSWAKSSSTSTRRSSRPTAAASPTSSPPRARTASVRRNPPRPPALPKRADSCSPAAAASSSGARICGRCIRTASCSSSTGPWMR